MAQTSSSRSRRFGLAALALATILPSGPAGAEPGPDDMTSARSPALVLAQAATPAAASVLDPAVVGPVRDFQPADFATGGTYEFDGAIRINGDLAAERLHIIADHIEVIGSVTGTNIYLDAHKGADRRVRNPHEATLNAGTLTIHGDVNIIDGRLGAPGTKDIRVFGNSWFERYQRQPQGSGVYVTAQNACFNGALHSEYGATIAVDNLTVSRDVTGQGLWAGVYAHPSLTGIPGNGRTVIGGNVDSANFGGMVISNTEVAIGGEIRRGHIQVHDERTAAPIQPGETQCAAPQSRVTSDEASVMPIRKLG